MGEEIATFGGHTGDVHTLAFNPDDGQVATAGLDATARLWDVATGRQVITFSEHVSPVVSLAFNPDGTRIATAGGDNTARLWDADESVLLLVEDRGVGFDPTRISSGASHCADMAARGLEF